MKRYLKAWLFAIMLCAVFCLCSSQSEAASRMQKMTKGKVYNVKLTGSKKHKIKYTLKQNYTDYIVKMKIYVDGKKVKTLKISALDAEVMLCTVSKNRTLLYVRDVCENDWNRQLLIYEFKNKKLSKLADLASVTRSEGSSNGKFLDSWARGSLQKVSENKLTIRWLCTGRSTGMYYIDIPYKVSGTKITRSGSTYKLRFSASTSLSKTWTAQRSFTTYKTAGGSEASFYVSNGQKVTPISMTKKDGTTYFQIKNADGTTGWFADPASYTLCPKPYFEEAQFAG